MTRSRAAGAPRRRSRLDPDGRSSVAAAWMAATSPPRRGHHWRTPPSLHPPYQQVGDGSPGSRPREPPPDPTSCELCRKRGPFPLDLPSLLGSVGTDEGRRGDDEEGGWTVRDEEGLAGDGAGDGARLGGWSQNGMDGEMGNEGARIRSKKMQGVN